jgi:phosphoribosyl-AMP cyclohydrolase
MPQSRSDKDLRRPAATRPAGQEALVSDPIDNALGAITFGPDGLVPAIAQQHDTGEVLMLAWMNREAVRITLAEGRACYWSRSRQALWRKGETSGQVQHLKALRLDCDGDTILLLVDQEGVACHTGRRNCFFHEWRGGEWAILAEPQIPPEQLYPAEPRN